MRLSTQASYGHGADGAVAVDPPAAAVAVEAAATRALAGNVLAVVGIVLAFLVFGVVIVSLQCCFNACHRRRGNQALPSGRRRRRGGGCTPDRASGVDPAVLRSLPVTAVCRVARPRKKAEEEEDEEDDAAAAAGWWCAVCLADLRDGEEARLLPRCGHGFHAACVDVWLASHTTCPLCRLAVVAANPDAPPPSSARPPVPPQPDANLLPGARVPECRSITTKAWRDLAR